MLTSNAGKYGPEKLRIRTLFTCKSSKNAFIVMAVNHRANKYVHPLTTSDPHHTENSEPICITWGTLVR